jgi:predicted RNase H-like nuclease (RuvC/YqgF family)
MFHVEQVAEHQEKRVDKVSCDAEIDARNIRNEMMSLKSELCSFNDLFAELGSQIEGLKRDVSQSMINSEWAKTDMKNKNKTLLILDKKFEYVRDRVDRLRGKS